MPSLTLDDRLIWFAHCPKTGGTSIETAMVEQWGDRVGHLHWGWDLWWKRGGWRDAEPPNSPQHLVWDDARKTLPRQPDAVFALVRDPVARMMSEQRYQRHHRRGTVLGRLLAWLPFAFWLRLMLAIARRNPHAFDNHLRPQSDFVPEGAVVFRLEDGLDQALDWLGIETEAGPAPHQLKGQGPAQTVNAAEAALIATVFAQDYARFGYRAPQSPSPQRNRFDGVLRICAFAVVWLDRRGQL